MSWIIISNHHFTVYSFFLEIKGIPFFQKLPNFRQSDIILVISHYSPRKKIVQEKDNHAYPGDFGGFWASVISVLI